MKFIYIFYLFTYVLIILLPDFVGGSKPNILKKYNALEIKDVFQVLYVWIDGSGQCLRCKTKTVYKEPQVKIFFTIFAILGSKQICCFFLKLKILVANF